MQSSAGMVFRALLLLACLIAIPGAALWGSSLPTMLSSVLAGRWPTGIGSERESKPPAEVVQFERAYPTVSGSLAGVAEPAVPNRLADPPRDGPKWPAGALGASPSPVIPVVYQEPAEEALLCADSVAGNDRFIHIQSRLRQLGATYCLLESWGNQPDYYRFYCTMAVGGNPHFACPFQATHSDPLEAMAEVLQQVEAWRANLQ
jgi:hypothetical protein